jgi:N-hydroxyarylamine O-acetyltransferase
MELAAYLKRIGLDGSPRADLETLVALSKAHLAAVTFENLDVQLGRPVSNALEHCYEKIVGRGRGGWCYETNGLLGWVLQQVGFRVTRVSAGVMREKSGDASLGGHLALLVHLERTWLVDVGFGGSLAAPIALEPGTRDDVPYQIGLAPADGRYFRFSERAHGEYSSFDFRAEPADEQQLEQKCRAQQTDASSSFVLNAVVQRRIGEEHFALRGRVLFTYRRSGIERSLVSSAAEWLGLLKTRFALDVPEAGSLWPAICARHRALGLDED